MAIAASALANLSVSAGTNPSSVIALDNFDRQTSTGLGRAQIGGVYRVEGQSAAHLAVTRGSAYITGLSVGRSRGAWLPATNSADTRVEVAAGIPVASSAARHFYVGAEARRQPTGRAYRAEVSFAAHGRPILAISRLNGQRAATAIGVVGLNWTARRGQPFHVQLQVLGGQPTRLAARAWLNGTPTPDWALVTADTSPEQIIGAGAVGWWSYRSGASPVSGFAVGTFEAWSFDGNAPVSVPPSGPAPTDSMTSSGSTSTSASSAPTSSQHHTTSAPHPTTSHPSEPAPSDDADPDPPSSSSGAGARALGSSDYAIPAGAVFVSPSGSDSASGTRGAPLHTINAAVKKASAGDTIVLRGGSYHETVSVSKSNLTIQPYPGDTVWLDGSVPVSGWTKQGSRWVHSGWSAQFDHSASFSKGSNAGGFVNSSHPMAAWPDQVFIGGVQLSQVSSAGSVGPGEFAVDYGANTITVGSNPGDDTRASDLQIGMTVTAHGVTVQGIGVHRFATSVWQMGTVRVSGGSDTLRQMVVEDNASQGVSFGHADNRAEHLTVRDNGMTGIHGNEADGLVISKCLITGNNTQSFNASPSAAGIKITRQVGLTITGNDVEDNAANGIWTDESVRQFKIVNNTSRNNNKGVVTELSDTGIIANNVFSGGEIGAWVMDTGNVKIFNNSFSNFSSRALALQQDSRREATSNCCRDPRQPRPDPSSPWLTRNITAANNVFSIHHGYQLWAADRSTGIAADSMNLVIDGNLFGPAGSAAGNTMALWGGSSKQTKTYTSASAFDAARGKGWSNLQGTSSGYSAQYTLANSSAANSHAVPLPADVARAIGQPTGARNIGTF